MLTRLKEGKVKNFDQWTKELAKEVYVKTDEDQARSLSHLDEMSDEDCEEE